MRWDRSRGAHAVQDVEFVLIPGTRVSVAFAIPAPGLTFIALNTIRTVMSTFSVLLLYFDPASSASDTAKRRFRHDLRSMKLSYPLRWCRLRAKPPDVARTAMGAPKVGALIFNHGRSLARGIMAWYVRLIYEAEIRRYLSRL